MSLIKPLEPRPLPRRLSNELADLAALFGRQELTFGELVARMDARVYPLLLILLALPFCTPIPMVGLSTPFGAVIAVLGIRFALRKKPWLPKRLLKTRVPGAFFPQVLRGASRILGWMEKLLRPRYSWIFDNHTVHFVGGMAIFVCACLLMLPLPIPTSNFFPAVGIVLLAGSFSERDGVGLGVCLLWFLITVAFFAALFVGAIGGAEHLWDSR